MKIVISYATVAGQRELFYSWRSESDETPDQLKAAGLGAHYVAHDSALFYENAGGVPFAATYIQAKDDPIADLCEDIAAEEKVERRINGSLI